MHELVLFLSGRLYWADRTDIVVGGQTSTREVTHDRTAALIRPERRRPTGRMCNGVRSDDCRGKVAFLRNSPRSNGARWSTGRNLSDWKETSLRSVGFPLLRNFKIFEVTQVSPTGLSVLPDRTEHVRPDGNCTPSGQPGRGMPMKFYMHICMHVEIHDSEFD